MTARRKRLPEPVEPARSVWAHRRGERYLLPLIAVTVLAGYGLILMEVPNPEDPLGLRDMLPAVAFVVTLVLLHGTMLLFRSRCDTRIPALALLLAGLGLMLQVRLRMYDMSALHRPATYAYPLGFVLMFGVLLLFRRGRWRLLMLLRWPCYLAALLVLGGMMVWGERFRGALYLPGRVNPTEVVKVLLVVFTAGIMAARMNPEEGEQVEGGALPVPFCVGIVLYWLVPLAMLVVVRDLGMAVILGAVLGVMLWMGTGRWLLLGTGVGAAVAGSVALGMTLPHVQKRVAAWLEPFGDPTGTGWQILQGLTALYNGGLWGRGIGEGMPRHIPVASSDFVYAAAGEEIGFVGCALVLCLFALLFLRGLRIAHSARAPFPAFLAAGLTAALAVQTLVNVGGVTKALPLTGVTLPLVSYGGSSLVTTFLMIGLILAVSDHEAGDGKAQ